MRYGLNLPPAGPGGDARTLGELAAAAEDAGWDGVFLEDYLVYQNRQDIATYDPWVALGVMAMRTQRIRIGTEGTPVARRRPWKLARESGTVDHLSGGRLQLSIGLGVSTDIDFAHFGEESDNRRRASQLDEALEVLVGLWTAKPFSYTGEHFQIRDTTFVPRPGATAAYSNLGRRRLPEPRSTGARGALGRRLPVQIRRTRQQSRCRPPGS